MFLFKLLRNEVVLSLIRKERLNKFRTKDKKKITHEKIEEKFNRFDKELEFFNRYEKLGFLDAKITALIMLNKIFNLRLSNKVLKELLFLMETNDISDFKKNKRKVSK